MIGQTIKNYRITEKIGEGGMGVVYKAYDSRLDRSVALKFLPDRISDSEPDKKRFLQEARAASALDHHNTCTIHEIDETVDGKLFIVMPAYEGKSLDKLIAADSLNTEQIVDITIQIAEGLKAAHDANIIHRDIKSSNIMVDPEGHTVIMDFGLARRNDFTQLTNDGDTLGTVEYMSPEQALGKAADHRTDIWSLGVILYEMLTGKTPFHSEYPQATIYCILNEEAEELTSDKRMITPDLLEIVDRTLKKDLDERYQTISDLLHDLYDIKNHSTDSHSLLRSGLRTIYAVPARKRTFFSSLMIVTVVFVIGFYFYLQPSNVEFAERDWIMLSDFENETNEEVFNHFLGEVLEISLQQSSFLNLYGNENIRWILQNELNKEVAGSLSSDIVREAARYKEVNVILTPRIVLQDSIYLLSARLSEVTSPKEIKLGPYAAADQKSVLGAIDELARNVRLALGEPPAMISGSFTSVSNATTSSLEALKLYVDGVRLKRSDNTTAMELIGQSVQVDPDFAMAHAELGMNYYITGDPERGETHFQKALAQSERLTIRERLWVQAVSEDWRGKRNEAIKKYRAYLNLYPDDYNAWWRLGYSNLVIQNTDECIEAFNKVIEIEPREASALVNLATCHSAVEEYDQALKYYERAFDIRPEFKLGQYINNEYGFMLVGMGRNDDARSTFELMLDDKNNRAKGLRNLALLNMYEGKFSASIDLLKEAIRLNISNNEHLSEFRDRMYLARLYWFKGMDKEYEDELSDIGTLIQEQKFGPAWLARMGKIYCRSGHIAEAENVLGDIESRIEDPEALSGVRVYTDDHGFYYMLKGEIELAKEDYSRAIEFLEVAKNISFTQIGSLAIAYDRSDNASKAIEYYLQIIDKKKLGREYQQEWIMAHYRLAKVYDRIGQKKEALPYYRTFVELWENGDKDLPSLEDARNIIQSHPES
ncbi:protein kinase domain-containing protein [Balneola sp. MJW-20]|uniref:protein kinase domain-containing protein n=1 Tax=Gracilimonas aurantiaca TaxID=3234185 RepID=UPI00346653DE